MLFSYLEALRPSGSLSAFGELIQSANEELNGSRAGVSVLMEENEHLKGQISAGFGRSQVRKLAAVKK
jgi:hypothetical protein